MRYAIGCLSPNPSVRGDVEALGIAIRVIAGREPALRIVVLPLGILRAPQDFAWSELQKVARDCSVYISGAESFSGKLQGFILAPNDEPPLLQASMATQPAAAHVRICETPYGVLACLPGDDPWFPEYARLAVFHGAEILLNPCAEQRDQQSEARQLSRSARAWENHAVLACASAESDGENLVEIWDHAGELVVQGHGGSATAIVDLAALRERRRDPWVNFPATLRTQLYAGFYERGATTQTAADSGPAYDVLLMQAHQVFATDPQTRDATIQGNLQRALAIARPFCLRPATRLAVFPEFFLQGSAIGQTLDWWERMGIRVPGPETEQLAAFAQQCNVFVCGAVLEFDPTWPQRYFNTALIMAPSGEIILKYRKLQCADLNGILNVTTPGNIYTEYVARYGENALIPVVDTEIGRLGTLICFDSNWPELWRALALQGAEVICHPTSEIHSERRGPWGRAKRAHAAENVVYVASANAGSEQFSAQAPVTAMNRGHSALIDFHGRIASSADGPGVVPLLGHIDLGALRRARANPSENVLARFRPEAVAAAYRQHPGFPLDCFAREPMQNAAEGPALVRKQIEALRTAGIYQ